MFKSKQLGNYDTPKKIHQLYTKLTTSYLQQTKWTEYVRKQLHIKIYTVVGIDLSILQIEAFGIMQL